MVCPSAGIVTKWLMAMLPSAPGRYSGLNLAPVSRSTMLATIRNEISFPAPGPFGNITVTGFVGCHAKAKAGSNANRARSFFMCSSFD